MARNYNRLGAYIVAAMLTATAGFVGWRVAFPPDVAHFAIVLDRSESPAFPVCETVTSLVRRDLLQPATAKESKLTLIATGDATNSFQGRLVSKSFLPKKVAVIRNHRKQSLAEQTYFDALAASCRSLTKIDRSPILYAIAAAVADLRGRGCGNSSHCRVDVASDGNENVDATLTAALRGDERAEHRLAPIIDNTGITVAFCGVSQAPRPRAGRTARDGADTIDRVQKIWSAVFKDPALVTAMPFCQDGPVSESTIR